MISLPKNYETDTFSYPVLYFIDSEQQFQIMASTVQFLAENDVIPPMIIVGIVTSENRTRDLTPRISKEALENLLGIQIKTLEGPINLSAF